MQALAKRKRSSGAKGYSFPNLNPDRVYAVLVILPSIILLGIFVYGFIGQTFYWSLTDWSGLAANAEKNYIWLENYEKLFSDFGGLRFRIELVNTFFFTALFLFGCLALDFPGCSARSECDGRKYFPHSFFVSVCAVVCCDRYCVAVAAQSKGGHQCDSLIIRSRCMGQFVAQ
jgi:ABC-type sugar transport system permease subunit